jgi:superfamily I DNA and/or RNA helicase
MDWRRGNVAVTRSQRKLILIGSKQTLQHAPFFRACIDHCEERRWISFSIRIPICHVCMDVDVFVLVCPT